MRICDTKLDMCVRIKNLRLPPRTLAKIGVVLIVITVISFTVFNKTVFHSDYGDIVLKAVQSYYRVSDVYVKPSARNKIPRILFWPYIYNDNTNVKRNSLKCIETCPVKCDVTVNTSDIQHADAVVFTLTELWTDNWAVGTTKTIKFPSYRRPDQVWVVSNLEPPSNLYGDLRVFNSIFNWTLWYRSDATIYQPYGIYVPKTMTEFDGDKYELENRNIFKEKENEIIGVISNCKDAGMRYRYINKLSKYINIDLFGKCYQNVCGSDARNINSCNKLAKTYKFYLSFENSVCKDYVTEKYWSALEREQVPIVNWNLNNINKTIPIPGSYISAKDFGSPFELSEYIKKVSANETLYNSYFDWKKKYKLSFPYCGACSTCMKLHESYRSQVLEDFNGWVRHDTCKKVDRLNIIGTKVSEFLFWNIGI